MLHPALINIVSFFYPLGNTPAVCLTQDLPRHQKANILFLGCGDVRNVLFTTYSDSGTSELTLYERVTTVTNQGKSIVLSISHVVMFRLLYLVQFSWPFARI